MLVAKKEKKRKKDKATEEVVAVVPAPERKTLTQHELRKRAHSLAKQLSKKLKVSIITGRTEADQVVQYVSTGFQPIDDAISGKRDEDMEIIQGTGKGWPRGRIIEIYGPEAAAKTSLSLATIAEAQKNGELCAFLDVEHALDETYARNAFGVDMEALLWSQPDNGEEALELLLEYVKAGVGIIVVDSVAALLSKAEAEGGKALGEQARLMSGTCRKLTRLLKPSGPCVIFLNQIRYKIGVMFGNPEITSGGNALKFYSSVRAEVRKEKELSKQGKTKGKPNTVGVRIKMVIKKNKIAPMGGRALFDVRFGKGIKPVVKRVKKEDEETQGDVD